MKRALSSPLSHCLVLAVMLLASTGCFTNSETGRRQLLVVSSEQEMTLGFQSFDKMKAETPINKDPAINALVQKVGKRIAAVADLPGAQWEFVVFQSDEVNAFCLPGGKIGIYTGILPITKDEAGLAAVMGHEVAHATMRHGNERISQSMMVQGTGKLLGTAVETTDSRWQQAIMTGYSVGSKVGFELPFSRKHESEADRVGLRYMARAGYEPEGAIAFWERFAAHNKAAGGSSTMWFLRTHPLDETRIKQLKEWLPEAKTQFKPAAK